MVTRRETDLKIVVDTYVWIDFFMESEKGVVKVKEPVCRISGYDKKLNRSSMS